MSFFGILEFLGILDFALGILDFLGVRGCLFGNSRIPRQKYLGILV